MMSIQASFLRTFLQLRRIYLDQDVSVDKTRARMKWSNRFVKLPPGVKVKYDLASGIPVEWIIPAHASSHSVILYIHGGGWILGWTNIHRRMVMHLSQAAACCALAVEYRLAPEHPFPAALEDCVAVYHWLLKDEFSPQNVMFAGDSAGANLTLATLLSLLLSFVSTSSCRYPFYEI